MNNDQNNDIALEPDEEFSGADATAKVKKLREEVKASEREKQEYLDGWQRAKADLANFKREENKRFDEFVKFATEGIVAEVLQVLDSFDLALRHDMPKDVERGIILIRSQLEDILRRRGLESIPAIGQKFDPAYHEAIGEIETAGEEGMVAEELQKGYSMNGRVLRPARVKISKLSNK